ncbi:MAG: ABC transporter permease [Acidobacteriota bacterium]
MDGIRRELRQAWRSLQRSPLFAVSAVVMLALGVSANTAVHSLVEAILLRPLPYAEPARLADLSERRSSQPDRMAPVSVPNYFDWRARGRSFEDMAGYYRWQLSLTGQGQPERVWSGLVTASLFPTLGVRPMLGRTFTQEEDAPDAGPVVVLSHAFWMQRFGGSREAVGGRLTLDGKPHQILGVMPPGFDFPKKVQLWVPLAYGPDSQPRDFGFLNVVARLRPGVPFEQAASEMDVVGRRLAAQYPDTNAERAVRVLPLQDRLVGDVRKPLAMLAVAVLLVLAVACANLVNLLLARYRSRGHEALVRNALGARRAQMLRPALAEGLLLGLLGGGAGLAFAYGLLRAIVRIGPKNVPRLDEAGLEPGVVALGLALALAAGIGSSLLAAGQVFRLGLRPGLRLAAGAGSRGDASATWLRRGLMVSEIALSLVVLAGAGLLAKSLAGLQRIDPGFDPSHLLTMQVELPQPRYPEEHQPPAFFSQLYGRIGALPGVERVGGIFLLPYSGMNASTRFTIDGRPETPGAPPLSASMRPVSPGYFSTLRIPVRRGRVFGPGDRAGSPPVVVVNESAARLFWPGEDPVGRRITFGVDFDTTGKLEEASREIVGVVGDVRQGGPLKDVLPAVYFPHLQSSWRMMSLAIRSATDPAGLTSAVRRTVFEMDRELPVSDVRTMDEMVAESVAQPRFYALLVGHFAVLALVLALTGAFGVIACSIAERTQEIGIRMALGAEGGAVLRLVLKEALALTLAGLALGLAAAPGLTRMMAGQLHGVDPRDPAVFAGAAAALLAASMAASWLPARRATRLTPMAALADQRRGDREARGLGLEGI